MIFGLLQSDDILAQKLGASGSTPAYSPLIGQDIETIFSTPERNVYAGYRLPLLDYIYVHIYILSKGSSNPYVLGYSKFFVENDYYHRAQNLE